MPLLETGSLSTGLYWMQSTDNTTVSNLKKYSFGYSSGSGEFILFGFSSGSAKSRAKSACEQVRKLEPLCEPAQWVEILAKWENIVYKIELQKVLTKSQILPFPHNGSAISKTLNKWARYEGQQMKQWRFSSHFLAQPLCRPRDPSVAFPEKWYRCFGCQFLIYIQLPTVFSDSTGTADWSE